MYICFTMKLLVFQNTLQYSTAWGFMFLGIILENGLLLMPHIVLFCSYSAVFHRGQTSEAVFSFKFARFIHDAVETRARIYKIVGSLNIFSFLSNKRVSLLLNVPHLKKITFTNCADKSVSRFQTLRTFF